MAKYHDIVAGSWEQRSLFPESVPHLFHYDMTYLWVLEQQQDQRPKTWLTRVEAWKMLVRMFLLEQVAVVSEDLRTPFIEVAERFGVTGVTWLKSRQSGQPIGVLSPTVLVRPLPDFTDADLERWRGELKDHEIDFEHLVFVAIKDLIQMSGTTPYAPRLAEILRKEFSARQATTRPPAGRPVAVPILDRLTWERRQGDRPPLANVNLLIRSAADRAVAEYIPYCAACGSLLLRDKDAEALEVTSDTLTIRCENSECSAPDQKIPLELLGIWLRNASTAVLWTPALIPPMPDLRLPPEPAITGSQLLFEWNKASAGGETVRRFLKLSFGDRQVQTVPLMSIFFERLLVPGRFSNFQGRALAPEWGDAIHPDRAGTVRVSEELNQVEFREMKVRGWPVTFSKIYKDTALVRAPHASVALFPDPSVVGSAWKWYRAFVHGEGIEDLEVHASGMMPLLPTLAATETGLPPVVGVRSTAHKSTGVCYIPAIRPPLADFGGTATASLAVDFGTTNTLVYHQPPGAEQVARAKSHGLAPRTFSRATLWLADSGEWANDELLGNFLPGPRYRSDAVDAYLIPSEAWRIGRQGLHLVRWMGDHPDRNNKYPPATLFKWDRENADYSPTRLAFLKEVLLQALPVAMMTFDPARVTTANVGFAYPLAFEHQARVRFRELLESLATDLTKLTGIEFHTTFSINESAACVNAFGSFNGETFLVADMGGGTLDVALFSMQANGKPNRHQIGSLHYGGERCVVAMSEQLAPKGTLQELRDAIARGDSDKRYGKQDAEVLAARFATIAFEFLRHMVAADRQLRNSADENIRVVLVGNGWHLVEAFSRETRVRGSKNVYLQVYEAMVRALGDAGLSFYKDPPLTEFPSSKHLVVAGALQNVTSEVTKHELANETNPLGKLPAGRDFRIGEEDVAWHQLVGEGIDLPGNLDLGSAMGVNLVVNMSEDPVPAAPGWRTRFGTGVGAKDGKIPYPTHAALLRELRTSISGDPPKLRRGPLQVILELEWSRTLMPKHGGGDE